MLSLTFPILKPSEGACVTCPYNLTGQGFAPDHVPAEPKLAILTDFCSETAMNLRIPLGNDGGRQFIHKFFEPVGFNQNNTIISSVLRCRPPEGMYPIGDLRKQAEKKCRLWDNTHQKQCGDFVEILNGGLNDFKPNYFFITVDSIFINRTWSITRVVQKDIEKVGRLSQDSNKRILVLLGDTPMKLVCSDLDGGVLKWRSHHGPLDWSKFQERFKC